ncbi:TPA: four helix bundle protein [Candidatus Nomurabacteria bacterium]|nr:four helix bundle protein [Candidatus Nomurabacteria bacterium]
MNKIQTFTDLITWQEGHRLVLDIYQITKTLPKQEQYGITSQIQRAAVSITCNIAEGFGRQGQKEKIQFYYIAHGSLTETQNLIFILQDTDLISKELASSTFNQIAKVQALLNGLIRSTKL